MKYPNYTFAVIGSAGFLVGCLLMIIMCSLHSVKTVPLPPFDVYLINLDRAKARLEVFQNEYDQSDLSKTHSLIRFAAVDGKTVDLPSVVSEKALGEILQAERLGFRSKHYELTRGGVGCWLSHVNLWKSLLESDKTCALIFEDDAIIDVNLHAKLKALNIPEDWDFLAVGYICKKCYTKPLGDTIQVNRFFGLHAYLINTTAIKKFLNSPYSKVVTKQLDSVISELANDGVWNVYATKNKMAWQNDGFATQIQMPLLETGDVDPWAQE